MSNKPRNPELPASAFVFLGCLAIATLVAAAIWFLTSPVPSAGFKLTARTQFVDTSIRHAATLTVASSDWKFHEITSFVTSDGSRHDLGPYILTGSSADKNPGETLITLHLSPGSGLLLRTGDRPGRGPDGRFHVGVANAPANAVFQLPNAHAVISAEGAKNKTADLRRARTITAVVKGGAENVFSFLPTAEQTSVLTRFQATALTFSQVLIEQPQSVAGNHADSRAGLESRLLEGTLQFVDVPNSDVRLLRGSDVTFSGVDATVHAVGLGHGVLELVVSGRVQNVLLHIAGEAKSLMPTWFDRYRNSPSVPIVLGALSAVFTLVGLLLSAAQVIRRVQRWFNPDESRTARQ